MYTNNMYNQQAIPRKTEIIRVSGKDNVMKFPMYPNSEVLLLDVTAPIIWLVQTDMAGYKTVEPFTITPYQPKPEITVEGLDERLRRLEGVIIDAKESNASNDES